MGRVSGWWIVGNSYSGSRLSEVQEPHPQPPPRKQGGGYDVPHVIRKRYSCYWIVNNY